MYKAEGTRAIFYSRWQCNFKEIIVLPLHIRISVCSMSCAGNAETSENCRKIENSEYFGNFMAHSAI